MRFYTPHFYSNLERLCLSITESGHAINACSARLFVYIKLANERRKIVRPLPYSNNTFGKVAQIQMPQFGATPAILEEGASSLFKINPFVSGHQDTLFFLGIYISSMQLAMADRRFQIGQNSAKKRL